VGAGPGGHVTLAWPLSIGSPDRVIPNVFHFCYGFLPEPQFGFLEYLAIKSAHELNRPERIYFHYQHECTGPWWEKAAEMLTLNRVEPPREIFGRKLKHFAHRSDVLRLQMLLKYGGIYMDIDTLCLRPFTPLLKYPCVMAWQSSRGLCNAVILSEPENEFLRVWLDTYRSFRSTGKDQFWDEHSVVVPGRLARRRSMRSHVKLLSHRAFFFPLCDEMDKLFESGDPAGFEESYCVHYCESVTRTRWLSRITPENVSQGNTNFARFVRRVLEGKVAADGAVESPLVSRLRGRTLARLGATLGKVRWIDSARHKTRWLCRRAREIVLLPRLVANLGFVPALGYVANWLRLAAACPTKEPFLILRSKRALHPLRCRGFADLAVFDRVFLQRRYACIDDARDVKLIVDCGAHVGYASAYFLTRFPNASLIALEPDPDHYAVLQANLAAFGNRARAERGAIWSHRADLVLTEAESGQSQPGKARVRPPLAGEPPSVAAQDLATLLQQSGFERISLLRMNIGGAEATVFQSDCQAWIDRVDRLVVDLHGEASRWAFEQAMARADREVLAFGPVRMALRRV